MMTAEISAFARGVYSFGSDLLSKAASLVAGEPSSEISLSFEDPVSVSNVEKEINETLKDISQEILQASVRYQKDLVKMRNFSSLNTSEKEAVLQSLHLITGNAGKLIEFPNLIVGLSALRWLEDLLSIRETLLPFADVKDEEVSVGDLQNHLEEEIKKAKKALFENISPHSMSQEIWPGFEHLLDYAEAREFLFSFLCNGPLRIFIKGEKKPPWLSVDYASQEIRLHPAFLSSIQKMKEAMLFGLVQLSFKSEADEITAYFNKHFSALLEAASKKAQDEKAVVTPKLLEDIRMDTCIISECVENLHKLMQKAIVKFRGVEKSSASKFSWDPLNKTDWDFVSKQVFGMWDVNVAAGLKKLSRAKASSSS